IHLGPDSSSARASLINVLLNQHKSSEAHSAAQEAVQLFPESPEVRQALASVLTERGKVTEAIAEFREALRLKPGYPPSQTELARAIARLGNWDEAIAEHVRALESDSRNYLLWTGLTTLHAHTGDMESYRTDCDRILDLFEKQNSSYMAERVARCCLLQPDAIQPERVDSWLSRVMSQAETNTSDRNALVAKGLAEYRAGRYASASEWLARFEPRPKGYSFDALAFAVMAMAKHRLGDGE